MPKADQLMNICIVSGCDSHRFTSDVNHGIYARRHHYDSVFDVGPYPSMQNFFFLKIHAVRKILPRYDWVFWLDDDAFFTNLDVPVGSLFEGYQGEEFLFICQGLVSTLWGRFTFLNSGVFLIKNCREAMAFLDAVSETTLSLVKAWWDRRRVGLYTAGDQDAITYVLHEHALLPKVRLLPYNAFNNRPYHYVHSATENFVVHFRVDDKSEAIQAFGRKFNLDESTLLPHEVMAQYRRELAQGDRR